MSDVESGKVTDLDYVAETLEMALRNAFGENTYLESSVEKTTAKEQSSDDDITIVEACPVSVGARLTRGGLLDGSQEDVSTDIVQPRKRPSEKEASHGIVAKLREPFKPSRPECVS